MTKLFLRSSRLVLVASVIVSLTASQLCGGARAQDRSADKLFRTPAAAFSPIGSVYSLGEVSINGHKVHGQEMICCGEVIEADGPTSAQILLGSGGRVVLMPQTILRLDRVTSTTDNKSGDGVLISLFAGEVRVKQQGGGITEVERFCIDIRNSQPVAECARGAVSEEVNAPQRIWIMARVRDLRNPLPSFPASKTITVPAKKKKELYFAPIERDVQTRQTFPAPPHRRVIAEVLTPGVGEVGSQRVVVETNDYGVARVTFTAGRKPGSTEIVATDEDSRAEWRGKIKVVGFWRARNVTAISAAVAAGVIATILKVRKGPLRQEGMPTIP